MSGARSQFDHLKKVIVKNFQLSSFLALSALLTFFFRLYNLPMQLHIDLIIPLSPTILPNGEYRKDVLLIFRFPFYGERAAYSATRKRRKNFVFSCRKMSENA